MNLITAVWMNISARLRRFRAHLIRVSISLTISCRTFYISHTVAGDEICGAEMTESPVLKNSLTIYRQKQTTSAEMSRLGSFLGLMVLNPIGLDTKKPRNYLIVRGLSRIFRFSSEVHSGAGGD